MRNMTPEKAATEIRRAYGLGRTGAWVTLTHILNMADLSREELEAGVQHLRKTDRSFDIAQEPYRTLTAEDRANGIVIGGECCDVIIWS